MLKVFVQKLFKFIHQNEKVWTIMAIHFAFQVLAFILPHKAFRKSALCPCLLLVQVSCAFCLSLNIC
jgi:hypothetical protein